MIIPTLAMISLVHCVTFICDFRSYSWSFIGDQYTCYQPYVISDGNLTHVLNITGPHLSGKSNADVRAFYPYTDLKQFKRIPKGVEKFFPDLLAFVWPYGNLSTIAADDLKPFQNLQAFHAYGSGLVSLEGDLFKYTPKLEYISLDNNLLEHVGFGLLDNLRNLSQAYFRNNPCIDMAVVSPAGIQQIKFMLQNNCPPQAATVTTSSSSTSLAPTTITNSTVIKSTAFISTSTESASTTISSTTESGHCSIGCVELINILEEENLRQNTENLRQDAEILKQNEEIARFKNENASQADEIAKQIKETNDLRAVVARQGDAIVELEKQIREIYVRP